MTTDIRTARWTGAAYLALGLAGMAGFLLVRPRVAAEPQLAALGVTLELAVVIAQAAAAVGFFALFRRDRPVEAFATATFGMGNALAILGSAALLTAAIAVSSDPSLAPAGDLDGTVVLLRVVADAFWSVGNVFFGLWLIPMGWFVLSTRRMPVVLGWFLVVGGVGYVLSAVLVVTAPGLVAELMVIPATVGEFWMIGYLLIRGIRPAIVDANPQSTAISEQRSV
ncbi:DUF4386 domain-containing protein [Microbacterium sp. 2FI]|uniref:DUF4386 domain-containing protein n=1 Tax=Microbacterium sp. 2FI TaxID=2502193 RepID=UPI0010F85371|nr:DUF4386 domain-containing protein [Microbacterium sp. 2FI]